MRGGGAWKEISMSDDALSAKQKAAIHLMMYVLTDREWRVIWGDAVDD